MDECPQAHQAHAINTRGVHSLWQPYCAVTMKREVVASLWYLLLGYSANGMGDRRTVPCCLDCCKTLPWTATTRTVNRIDHRRLFYGVDKNTHILLCIVSLWFERQYCVFPLKFACTRFVTVSCIHLLTQLPAINVRQTETSTSFRFSSFTQDLNSTGSVIYSFIFQICQVVQMFVLGPRLILGVREYHAKLVASSDAACGTTSIAFQERIHISTSNGV